MRSQRAHSGPTRPLLAGAAAIAMALALLPAQAAATTHGGGQVVVADAGHGHGEDKAMSEKATKGHHMKAGSGDTAKARQSAAPSNGAGLLMPMMNPARGRKVFAAKGCVICHAINGVGGDHGPNLDMSNMGAMNPFDFAAKMWEGAEAMIVLQEEELGERISLTGQDLADMIAFVHSPSEIKKFSAKDVPHKIMDVYQRTHGKGHSH